MFDKEALTKRGLIHRGGHLPYNPDNVSKARELRKNMTEPEKKLWFNFLCALPDKVYKQRPIDNYIADFYCPAHQLIIEVDGESHFTEDGMAYDKERTNILSGYGLKDVRFTNMEVMTNFEGVCSKIQEIITDTRLHPVIAGVVEKY